MQRLAFRHDKLTDPARASDDPVMSTTEFHDWWADRHLANRFSVDRIPFAALTDWQFEPATGNLGHASGHFFTIEGLQIREDGVATRAQPIINQSEIGILGIVVKDIGGTLHCLMQAKMEPGNINTLQLSPTVQATRSNYMQVHHGAGTRYLEHFVGPGRGQVLVDVLQSEQGAWFWRKRNRNMVVLVTGDAPVHDDYCWLSLTQLGELLQVDNLVNMDARTVLSCMPFSLPDEVGPAVGDPFRDALIRSYQFASDDHPAPLHTAGEILSWFTEAKTTCSWEARLAPLAAVPGWSRGPDELADDAGSSFRIVAVAVEAGTREVRRWTQPLLYPRGEGRAAFVVRAIDGVAHLLVQARPEFGLLDMVEMAPTIHLLPGQRIEDLPDAFLRSALASPRARLHYDNVLSEEGGRFFHAITRYQVIEVGEDMPLEVPPHYRWMTIRQLIDLLRHGHYLDIEARSLLACLHSLC